MKPSHLTTLLVLLTTLVVAVAAFSAVPTTINYQGYLKNTDGTPVNTATSIRFSLYSSNPARSNPVWTETKSVTPSNGIYSTQLGSVTPVTATFDVPYWLGVKVEGDAEMDLQELSSAPYARRAATADAAAAGSIGTSAITDNSITTTKIVDGTIAAVDLASGSVTSAKLATDSVDSSKILNGSIAQVDMANNSIGTAQLNDGSVTDAKITGPISAAKLDLSGVQKKYAKTAIVAQSGGDYTSPVTAMGSVTTWCGTPSSSNPCLLKIMPGIYGIGANSLVMQSYVDIEGSGEETTVISGIISSSLPPSNGVVNGASSAEIRFITINNSATAGGYLPGMVNIGASPKMTHVTISATVGGGYDYYGVYNVSSSPSMSNVTIKVSGGGYHYGVYNGSSSSPAMTNVTITASGGSRTYGVYNVTNSSPYMTNVTVTAVGGTEFNFGVYNLTSSSPVMTNITIEASGGTNNYGVTNNNSSPAMTNVAITASGGFNNYGVINIDSSSILSGVTAKGSGGSGNNYGLYNSATSSKTILVDRSTFEGGAYSIVNNANVILKIGASKRIGPQFNTGTIIYSGVYDDAGAVTATAFSGNGSSLSGVNAATVTNGVYTTGSYANPSWISSLAGSKISGDISAGNIRINNNELYLRDGTDTNHGLGWYGTGKPFATLALDGPVLYGWSGGALGTTNGGQKIMLKWDTGGFDFYGYARFRVLSSGSTSACLDANNSISTCSSDARMKKDVVPLSESMDVLGALSQLRGVTFAWDKSNEKSAGMADGRDLGMIAQEVEQVFPEVVHTDKDGYKSMDYPKLVSFLIEVNKAQQAQLDALNKRLNALEAK